MKIKWIFQVIEKTCSGDVVWATFSELRKAKQYLKENDFNESDYFKILLYKVDSEEYKELRYTGYKDVNEVEIYDGDILAYLENQDYWWIRIEYYNGSFMVRDADKIRYNNKIYEKHISDINISNWRIIGNIYENEGLL